MVVTEALGAATTSGGTHGVDDLHIAMAKLEMVEDMLTSREEYWRRIYDLLDEFRVVVSVCRNNGNFSYWKNYFSKNTSSGIISTSLPAILCSLPMLIHVPEVNLHSILFHVALPSPS